MANALMGLENLISLTVATSGQGANDESMHFISKAFERLTGVNYFTFGFYDNNLTDKGAEILANSISQMINLKSLRINICG
jgi:hypothetical protein